MAMIVKHMFALPWEAGYEDLLGTQWTTVTTTQPVFSQQCQNQVNDLSAQVRLALAGLD